MATVLLSSLLVDSFSLLVCSFLFPQNQDLRQAFMLFDKDKSGYIEAREIREVTTTMGMPLSLEELEDFMKMADQNGDGRLDYNEFVKAMTNF